MAIANGTCFGPAPYYVYQTATSTTRVVVQVLRPISVTYTDPGCEAVFITPTEYQNLKLTPPLTIANVNELAAAIAALWALAWVLRQIKKQIPN